MVQASMIIGCSAYLAYLSTPAFLCLLVLIAIAMLSFRISHKKGQLHMTRARRCADNIVRQLQYLTGNIKELQLHSRTCEGFLKNGLGEAVTAYKKPTLIGSAIYSINANWSQLMFFAVMGILLYAGPRWLTHESPGLLTGYGLALLFLIGPVTALTTLLASVGAITAAFGHLGELGLELVQNGPQAEPAPDSPSWTSIRLNEVVHTYRFGGESGFSVGPLTFELKQGEILFIIGGNGSGKTTAAKLCCGLYYPDTGEIRLNGLPLEASDMATYRELFSVVFSDLYHFDRLFGIPDGVNQSVVNQLLHRLGFANKLTLDTEGRLSTSALSRGQEKRVALLAACLEDRPIYIFDEWAADQDPDFKKIFYYEILPELRRRGKGVIVVSHDDRYFDVADTIIKMDFGKIQSKIAHARAHGEVVPVDASRQVPSTVSS
jgi:putative ATP-binding cassette transporter